MEIVSYLLLFSLVFGMSATVNLKNLQKQIRNKAALLTGVALQFGVLPFLGFSVVKALNLSAPMGITLLVLTSSPGGSYSNWWCSMFNADLALSVTMTAISTVLSVAMLPLNLAIYSTLTYSGDIVRSLDWISLFTSLFVVIGAIFLGLICSTKIRSKKFNKMANKLGNVAGVAVVLFSIFISTRNGDETESTLWVQPWEFYFGVALPCVVGLCIANFLSTFFKLEKPERVTVSVECCYQNVGIAASVALTMFDGDDLNQAIGVPLYYGGVEGLVLGLYCIIAWKLGWTKAPKDESFCVIVGKSYEIEDDNDAGINDEDSNGDGNRGSNGPKKSQDREGQEDENTLDATVSLGATSGARSIKNDKNSDGNTNDARSLEGQSSRISLWAQHGAFSFLSFGTAPSISTQNIQDERTDTKLARDEKNLDDDEISVESSASSSTSGWGRLGDFSFHTIGSIKAVNMAKDGMYDLDPPNCDPKTEEVNASKDLESPNNSQSIQNEPSNTHTEPTNTAKDGLHDLESPSSDIQTSQMEPISMTIDGRFDLKG